MPNRDIMAELWGEKLAAMDVDEAEILSAFTALIFKDKVSWAFVDGHGIEGGEKLVVPQEDWWIFWEISSSWD